MTSLQAMSAGIGLHVFEHNRAAQPLHRKHGYAVASLNMYKPFASGDA